MDASVAGLQPAVLDVIGTDSLAGWFSLARARVPRQGLPARVCWLGLGEREAVSARLNALVAHGEIGPLALGRDHIDPHSVASPSRETEGMRDGSDAIADWPVLSALLNAAQGASWVAIGNGGGIGIGRSIHSAMTVVADGSELAARKIRRVFHSDPALAVARYANAGYPEALEEAARSALDLATGGMVWSYVVMAPAGELAIVLHTHMPYVERFGTWPFGEEWLWEAIATSYLPLLDVLDGYGSGAPAPVTHAVLPLLATDRGVDLQVRTGIASHRRRFGGWGRRLLAAGVRARRLARAAAAPRRGEGDVRRAHAAPRARRRAAPAPDARRARSGAVADRPAHDRVGVG
jgi:hypothetical protein